MQLARPQFIRGINKQSPLARGLIFAIPLNENGGQVKDVKRGIRLTSTGSPVWGVGKYGPNLGFNGSSQYLTIPDSPLLDELKFLTVSILMRKTAATSGFSMYVSRAVGADGGSDLWLLYNGDNALSDAYAFAINTGSATYLNSSVSSDADIGQWVTITGVYDGTTMKLYRNKVLIASGAKTGTLLTESNPIRIAAGDNFNTIVSEFAPIEIANVLISNRPWTAKEVAMNVDDPWGVYRKSGLIVKAPASASTANVSPLVITLSIPSVTATYVLVVTASVAPLVAVLSIPTVTATYSNVATASVSPLVLILSFPSVTASVTAVFNASVSPLVLHLTMPDVTPNLFIVYSVVAPQAIPIRKSKFTFIVESMDGTFEYATEDWEFNEIVRNVNGSMMVNLKTNQLTEDIANHITDLANRVTIRVSTPNTGSTGINYFSGYIPSRNLILTAENNSLEITAFGHASRLFDVPYRNGTTVVIDKTAGITASELVIDIIDKFQALDTNSPITYLSSSIEDSVDDVKDIFKLQTCGDVLNKATVFAYDADRIWHYVINGDNIIRFKKSSTTADHHLVFGRDVVIFPVFNEDLQQSKNEVLIVYNGGANIKRVADSDNIALYGLRSLTVNETNIPDAPTATEMANAYLASRSAPIRAITARVVSTYPIELINPGDTCRIDGLPIDIAQIVTQNMFIAKITYRKDYVDLELSLKSPYISNQVDAIRRRFEQESVADTSATTYS